MAVVNKLRLEIFEKITLDRENFQAQTHFQVHLKPKNFMRFLAFVFSVAAASFLTGCASTYIPPSGRADFSTFTTVSMQEGFAAKPAAGFPAGIAAVRVQTSNYRSFNTEREGGVYGSGRYSVITVKDVEDDADLERLQRLPNVGGLISISPLLLPKNLQSEISLREAAARLKADMLLLYTFDTTFHENDSSVTLSVISLGILPMQKVSVHVTASALVIDTRTGFIYAALEANEKRQLRSNAWESDESADRARRDAEKAAFKSLVGEFEKNWPKIVERAHQVS